MLRRESAANRLWTERTNGRPALASGRAGRTKANTSYHTGLSVRCHPNVIGDDPTSRITRV